MAIVIRVPAVLRRYSAGEAEVAVEARTAREALDALFRRHPGLAPRVLDGGGALHPWLRLYRGDRPATLDTALRDGDRLDLVGAAEGG